MEPVESDVLDKDVKESVDTLSQSSVTDVGAGPTLENSENGNEGQNSDNSSPQREGSLSRFLKGAKDKFDSLPPEWGQRRTS